MEERVGGGWRRGEGESGGEGRGSRGEGESGGEGRGRV